MDLKQFQVPTCPPDNRHPGWKVEILDNGQSVSRLWIVDKTMRLGGAQIRIGGISTVGTDEAYRGQGLAGQVMDAAIRLMERESFQASILHGIPDFYHRYSYAPCIPEYELRISARDAGRAPGAATLRPMEEKDCPAVARLYNGENAFRPGSIVRDPGTWKGFPRSAGFFMKAGALVAVNDRGLILGYLVFDDDGENCRASEVGGQGGEVLGTFLRFLSARAAQLGKEDILLTLPPDHPLSLYSRKFGCDMRIHYPRNGEFMGRLIDLKGFLGNVAAGLGFSGAALPDGRIGFSTDMGKGVISLSKGRGVSEAAPAGDDDYARISQGPLLQLFMGYRSAADLHATGELQGTPDQVDLLAAWFPLRNACLYWPDRF